MKGKMKLLLPLLLFVCAISASAQDVIVKKDGSTIVCRVVEVSSSEIIYKKWTDLNGSNYVMNRADVSGINYESGKKENFSTTTNLYAPNNQNDGIQQFNDKALLAIDQDIRKLPNKIKTYRLIGLIGGGAMIVTGVIIMTNGDFNSYIRPAVDTAIAGAVVTGCGVALGTTFCLIANHYKKQANRLQISSIYQHEIKFKNGTTFTPSIDMFKDQKLNSQGLGVGLCYNF